MPSSVYIFSFLVLALFVLIIYLLNTKKPKSSIGSNTTEIETKDTEVVKPASRGDSSISRYARPKDGDQLLSQSGYVIPGYTTSCTNYGHTSLQPENDFLPLDTPRGDSSLSRYARPKNEKPNLNSSANNLLTKSDISWHRVPDEFVIFDFETTGLTYHDPVDIIEISAVKVNKVKFMQSSAADTFTTLVRPLRGGLNPKATAVNNITQEMIDKEGVDISTALKDFMAFVGDSLLIAYNAKFDRWFLEREIEEQGIQKQYIYKCALQVARKAFPHLSNHKLITVASHLGISTSGAHRALQDCVVTLQVYLWGLTAIERTKIKQKEKVAPQITTGIVEGLAGKRVVFAGTLSHYNQSEAAEIARNAGMQVLKSASEDIDILVFGRNAGQKFEDAVALGKKVVSEDDFLTMILQEEMSSLNTAEGNLPTGSGEIEA